MIKNKIFDNLVVLDLANNHFGDVNHAKKIIKQFSTIIKKNKINPIDFPPEDFPPGKNFLILS